MTGKRIFLFNLFGFKVQMHTSLLILALFISWSLATGGFPRWYQGFSTITYWLMGMGGALGLFFSIVFHEFFHSIVARQYGLEMKGITLFIFGGVAEMKSEPPSAKAEFMMAIAGPISSIALGGGFYLLQRSGISLDFPMPMIGVLGYLTFINFVLAIFNLIPGFPLDGGRVLRSILWAIKKDIVWATRIASGIGSGFGVFLIVMGILSAFYNELLGGIWLCLIGLFLRGASRTSYKQLIIRKRLKGQKVCSFMITEPVTVLPTATIEEFIEGHIYRYHLALYPVVDKHIELIGFITPEEVKKIPREEWSERTVGETSLPCSSANTINPEAEATEAVSLMQKSGSETLMVVDGGRLAGVITLKDTLKILELRNEFGGK